MVASWAQAAAAHARGELHRSVWADLQETSHVPHLAARLFDDFRVLTPRAKMLGQIAASLVLIKSDVARK